MVLPLPNAIVKRHTPATSTRPVKKIYFFSQNMHDTHVTH